MRFPRRHDATATWRPTNPPTDALKKDDIKLEWSDKDEYTHVYRLVVTPENEYEVFMDGKSRAKGSLADGQWSNIPAHTVDDPDDKKPADWEDKPKIVDPDAKKPDDWDEDEPKQITDPNAAKPADWDDAEDGEWQAPLIDNPKHKGKWTAPTIDNPKYKGPWAPKKIPNPKFDPKAYVINDVGALGFELWVVNGGSIFSNIIVTDSVDEADALLASTYTAHHEAEKVAKKHFDEKNKPASEAKSDDGEDDGDDDGDKDEL